MKTFRPYTPDQPFLVPPTLQDWLPAGHPAAFISEGVDAAGDLTPILATDETGDERGQPAAHPALLVKLLLYGSCIGKPSSRQLEQATDAEIPSRVLAATQHPDHDTMAAFRQTHLTAPAALFAQGLRLGRRAGLVQLGHVALDGTNVLANASKHKAMSYGRMTETEPRLE
jgi:transposase